jgi:hypothetical protein
MAKTPIQAESVRDNSADTLLEQAWADRCAAYERYNTLPHSEDPEISETPEEKAEWAIIDEAEAIIRSAVASTPHGAAIQLWTALQCCLSDRNDEAAILRRDLQSFGDGERQEWHERLILSALRSLEAMGDAA